MSGEAASETHEIVRAPWTAEQIAALNAWQGLGYVHPYTCGMCRAVLTATAEGWECPECGCRQDWTHAFSADVSKHPRDPLQALRRPSSPEDSR